MPSETDAEHTPGPWEVDGQVSGTYFVAGQVENGRPGGEVIARVDSTVASLDPPNEANARLIAAAPTMKERLLRLNTMLSWYLRPDVDRSPEEDEIREMLQWTEDAIAKTNGYTDDE